MQGERLSLKTKIGYGLGDLYGGGAFIIVGTYYLHFLTDVVRITPVLAGLIIMISKIWDAISDPLMGIISDRTRTRFGRRRPYFLMGIPLIFISFWLLWYPVGFAQEWQRFAYMLFSYLFFVTVITMVMIPYNALAPELTLDYNERTSLTAFRMFFSMLSSVICAVLPLEIVKRFDSPKAGYMAMGMFFGAFFAIPFLFTFLATRERKEFRQQVFKFSFREFLEPFRNKTFVYILLMYLFSFLTMDVIMSVLIYYTTYYLGKGNITNLALGTLLIVEIAFIPFWSFVAKKYGKRVAFLSSVMVWIVAMFYSLTITPASSTLVIYLFAAFSGIGTGGVVITIYSMFADVPDVDELKSGQRREGIYSGLFTFMRKLSSAVGLFLVSSIISAAGYRPGQEQSETFLLVLRFVFAFLPVLLLTIALLFALKYPLTRQMHDTLKKILQIKRQNLQLDEELKREEEMLKVKLLGE
ncbi:MAG: Sugar (Glycoside-Pentoside-Hexuronide) transporter [Thermotoga sp. 50_1627]|uniref:MFS transporter n=1 Tax=Pseudothermotoga sp. TaxID=2033661 RepID=UPI00076C464F|nr:MAG: Sugar (Glycoside-Pentoside-Hexuronide) transporter [Thermotoga sp. 50_1627]MBC7117210.1 MFS transporter [Pseudothermotoga sp.]MDK2923859.1 oligogalacturonide transporter [Pseudothermotoga sp.]